MKSDNPSENELPESNREVPLPAVEDNPSGNKYQWADVVSNDDDVVDVVVDRDTIEIIYVVKPDLNLTYCGRFLHKKGYDHQKSETVSNGVQKDIFVKNDETD